LNFSDNYMRIRQKANTTDRRLVEFKFVSLLKPGVDFTHRSNVNSLLFAILKENAEINYE
jgi:hypothetical protein